MGAGPRPTLARCVAVGADRFAAEHWDAAPLLSRAGELPRDFTDLLTLADVDELLSRRGLRTPFLRLARDGAVIPPARYTGGGGLGAEIGDQIRDDAVARQLLDGATLVLQGLHRVWPPLVDFAVALAGELGHPVQVNAYVTPPAGRGFAAHYDTHDVFVLQFAGEKRWRIHAPVVERPARSDEWTGHRDEVAARSAGEPVLDTVLRPGDALYLPRGTIHAAEALAGVAGHLTVGVHPTTLADLARALADLALTEPALRRSLPLGVDVTEPGEVAGEATAAVELLVRALRAADPVAVTDRLLERALGWSRPAPLAPLEQVAAVEAADAGTLVRWRPGLRAALRTAGDRLALVLADRRIDLPATTQPAIRALRRGAPVRVGDLPGLPVDDAVVLTRRLLRESIVVTAETGR